MNRFNLLYPKFSQKLHKMIYIAALPNNIEVYSIRRCIFKFL